MIMLHSRIIKKMSGFMVYLVNTDLCVLYIIIWITGLSGFPLGLENLENLEKWEGIFQSGKSQGILNRLEKSGKSQGKSHKILENSGNLR